MNRYGLEGITKRYKAKSVNMEIVKKEQARINALLDGFQPEDCWNVDESALFAFATPDRVVQWKQMRGKQASEFRITICFACNSNGTKKRDLFFIGKSKEPRSFDQQDPAAHGFYYRANNTAWMTGALFEE